MQVTFAFLYKATNGSQRKQIGKTKRHRNKENAHKDHNSQPLSLFGLFAGGLVAEWTFRIKVFVVRVSVVKVVVRFRVQNLFWRTFQSMEWKIFIKALIGTWLVVSVSVLNIFALSLAALSAWHGFASLATPPMVEVAEEDDDGDDADDTADDDDDPELQLGQPSRQHRFSQLQVAGALSKTVACVAIIQTCAVITEFQSQEVCLLISCSIALFSFQGFVRQ